MPFTERTDRQARGLQRAEKHRGSGWFYRSPARYHNGVQSATHRIVHAYPELPQGGFVVDIGNYDLGCTFGQFCFSHPADVREVLEIARAEKPEELVGKKVIFYWKGESYEGQPRPGSPVLGVDLLVREELNPEECKYFQPVDPVLVLATDKRYNFRKGKEWIPINHQTAGVRCRQHDMMVTILRPQRGVLQGMRRISSLWFESNAVGLIDLDEVNEYRKNLNEILGVDCKYSYRDFEEAIYPIDCTPENIGVLTLDNIPDDLDDLIVHPDVPLLHAYWKLYILGPNSD